MRANGFKSDSALAVTDVCSAAVLSIIPGWALWPSSGARPRLTGSPLPDAPSAVKHLFGRKQED